MDKDNFLARCHPHMFGEGGQVDIGQCEALANDMTELRALGVILTLSATYAVGPYRYTSLGDALAQARRMQSRGDGP
jgi:hypothetical protein